jgi:fibronectin-binding autotransporter adhesin
VLSYTGTGSSTDRLFNMGGTAVSIGSNGTGPVNFTNTGAIGGGSLATLTLTGNNTGANTFAPLLDSSNVGALTKAGNGTWIVTNSNTYTGVTTVGGAGVLSVPVLANGGVASPIGASSNSSASLVLNGGTLRYTGTGHTTDRLFTLNNNSTLDASGTGPVVFNNSGAIAVPTTPRTLTLSGTNTGDNTLAGTIGSTNVVAKTGAGKWVLSGVNTYTGGTTVNAGTLVAANGDAFGVGALTVSNATAQAKVGLTKAVTVTTLGITGTGRVDLTDNDMVIKSSTLAAVQAQITSGFNGGAWNGPGVNSSSAATEPQGRTALGYVDNAELGAGTFSGVTGLTGTEILVKYTYYGDADISGVVDLDDFSQFLDGYQHQGTVTATWLHGDFDYSGLVDLDDFSQFLFGYQNQGAPLAALSEAVADASGVSSSDRAFMQAAISAVPEPASLGVIGLAGLALLGRRRRRD